MAKRQVHEMGKEEKFHTGRLPAGTRIWVLAHLGGPAKAIRGTVVGPVKGTSAVMYDVQTDDGVYRLHTNLLAMRRPEKGVRG